MLPVVLAALPPPLPGLKFARVTETMLGAAFAIEAASYPADEAATEEKLLMRMREVCARSLSVSMCRY
jgi:hypothetical protein